MAVSKAQQKAVTKYVKAKYDRFGLTMPKGHLDEIKAHAETQGESVNGFINRAIDHQRAHDCRKGRQEALQGPTGREVVSLCSETYTCAVEASTASGEDLPDFVARAVDAQAKRDKTSLALGINPATGGKLEKEA